MSWSDAVDGVAPRPASVFFPAGPLDPDPGPLSLSLGGKAVNLNGLAFGFSMALRVLLPIDALLSRQVCRWVTLLYPLVLSCAALSFLFDFKRRRPMGEVTKTLADDDRLTSLRPCRCGPRVRLSMLFVGYKPKIVGAETLPPKGGKARK